VKQSIIALAILAVTTYAWAAEEKDKPEFEFTLRSSLDTRTHGFAPSQAIPGIRFKTMLPFHDFKFYGTHTAEQRDVVDNKSTFGVELPTFKSSAFPSITSKLEYKFDRFFEKESYTFGMEFSRPLTDSVDEGTHVPNFAFGATAQYLTKDRQRENERKLGAYFTAGLKGKFSLEESYALQFSYFLNLNYSTQFVTGDKIDAYGEVKLTMPIGTGDNRPELSLLYGTGRRPGDSKPTARLEAGLTFRF
jgi:hypothetical protein